MAIADAVIRRGESEEGFPQSDGENLASYLERLRAVLGADRQAVALVNRIGAGAAVLERLREEGYRVQALPDARLDPLCRNSGPSLEERVAPLEGTLLPPAWTDEQAAAFREEWERQAAAGWEHREYEPVCVPPSQPLLTPETARALLRECVTAVKPGETLILRTTDLTPGQMREYQESFDWQQQEGSLPFPVLVVHADEVAVMKNEDDAA